jgi:ABC-type multidrug transport system permease subunit
VKVLLFARKDLLRIRRDPMGLLLWVCIPLLIGSMIALATGGSGGPKPRVELRIADQDGSLLSSALAGGFGMGPLRDLFHVEQVDAAVGSQQLRDDAASALLVIPKGFQAHLLDDVPVELSLVTNPAQRVLPGITQHVLRTFVDLVAVVRMVVRPALFGFASWEDLARESLRMTGSDWRQLGIERWSRGRRWFDPLAIEVVDAPKVAAAPAVGFGAMLWPGMLLMALFFVAQGLGEDLWEERQLGTLRRVLAGPAGLQPWLLGKILAGASVSALVGAVGLTVGALFFGLSWTTLPLGVPWVALSGMAMLLLFWPLMCIASSARGANVLSSSIGFPLLMLGGSFFPFEAMPRFLADIGRCTPNGWLLARLRALDEGVFEPVQLLAGLAAVAALALVSVRFCAGRLRRAVEG